MVLVRPVEAKVSVYSPTKPLNLRPAKVATLVLAFTEVVPLSTAPLPVDELTVTVALELVRVLPSMSWMVTAGCVVNAVRFVNPAAEVVRASLLAAPGSSVTVSVALVRPVAA